MAKAKKELKLELHECLKIELFNAEEKIRELEGQLLAAQVVLTQKDAQHLDVQKRASELEAKIIKQKAKEHEAKTLQVRKERETYLKQVAERLGIEGRWGYNPDTLEVHT
jgi:hypothetical protein